MKKHLSNLQMGLIWSNVLIANFGLKKMKDVITWLVVVLTNFVLNVEQNMAFANAIFLNNIMAETQILMI